MPTGWFGGMAQQAAGQAVGGAVAMGLQRLGVNYDQRKQRQQAQALQDIQMAGEKEMIDYSKAADLKMWKDTGYGAQKDLLKQAGMNPALMYGMGGGGGQTIGGGGPSVSGQGAQSPDTAKASGGMGIMTGAQVELMKAQTEALKAQANKTNAEVPVVGKQGQKIDIEIQDITQGIQNKKAAQLLTESQTRAIELANKITAATSDDQIAQVGAQLEATIAHVRSGMVMADVDEATKNEKISMIKEAAIGAAIDNQLRKMNLQKGEEEIKKIKQDILNSIQGLKLTEGSQRIEMRKAEITRTLGERGLDIAQQGVLIGALDKVIGAIGNATK